MEHLKLHEVIADKNTVRVSPETPVRDVVREMQKHHLGSALVFDANGLAGIFTGSNLVERVLDAGKDPAKIPVGEVMTPNPICLDCACQGFEAVRLMRDDGIRHIAVIGLPDGQYGVVSVRDFPDSELNEYESELEFEKRLWESL